MKPLLLAGAAAFCVVAGVGAAQAVPVNYVATLSSQNGSGVTGTATLVLDGTILTMTLSATGLVPNQPHPSHLHGRLGVAAPLTTLAPPSADTDGDGFVESPEGAVFEGPPLFDLPEGPTPKDYSTAPGGVISFTQTYDLADTSFYDPDGLGLSLTLDDILGTTGGNTVPLVDRIIEVHGLTVPPGAGAGTPYEVNGTGGYIEMLPVAGGLIRLADATAVPEPGSLALLSGGMLGLMALRRRRG